MKKVRPPPDFEDLISRYSRDPDVMVRILEASTLHQKTYHHWHKFKYLKPPAGLDSETWWVATKIARNATRRMLPFNDERGQPFSYVLTDQILEQLYIIDRDAKNTTSLAQSVDGEHDTPYMTMSFVEEAIRSSQLEGALTTRKVANEMIRSGRKPTDRSEQMIFNNYQAMDQICQYSQEPLTYERLMALHKTLCRETLDNSEDCGRIQTPTEQRVMVADPFGKVFFDPPPAEQLPSRIDKLIQFANQSHSADQFLHPILRAIVLHFMMAFNHPFVDGNGRVARALFYYSVLKNQYDAFAYVSISTVIRKAPVKYGYAFQFTETDQNDMTYFLHHQLEVICSCLTELSKYIQQKRTQISQIKKQLNKLSLNYRQLALLNHAAKNPRHVYTIYSHQNSHGCVYATARADLFSLAELNLLEKIQLDKKSLGFSVPDDFNGRISTLANS